MCDDSGVNPHNRTVDADADVDFLGGFGNATEDAPDKGCAALLSDPRVIMVGTRYEIETDLLCAFGLSDEFVRTELLGREGIPDSGHRRLHVWIICYIRFPVAKCCCRHLPGRERYYQSN